MLAAVIYVSLLGIPMVLLIVHMLMVLLQPSADGKQVASVQRQEPTPLGAGRLAPRRPVERPAPAVAPVYAVGSAPSVASRSEPLMMSSGELSSGRKPDFMPK
jgi:hypothetical protein